MNIRATLHLASGSKIVTHEDDEAVQDADEWLETVQEEMKRPAWHVIGNVLFFSQAISAIEAENYDRR
jgi:hypothetical protein